MVVTVGRRKALFKLWIDGNLKDNQYRIAAHMKEYYTASYKETNNRRPRLEGIKLSKISDEERGTLEEKMSKDESFWAIKSLAGDKAPRLDGFPLVLFEKGWGFLKTYVM